MSALRRQCPHRAVELRDDAAGDRFALGATSRVLVEVAAVFAVGGMLGCSIAQRRAEVSAHDEVSAWIRDNSVSLVDRDAALRRLVEIVGDADVIGFGEPDHDFHEFASLRNDFIKRLVVSGAVDVITLETGIIESRLVDRFVTDVRGESGIELERVLRKGLTRGMGECEEVRDLVLWVRDQNIARAARAESLVHWGGKDLTELGDTLTVPLAEARPIFERWGVEERLRRLETLATKAAAVTLRVESVVQAHGGVHIDPDQLDAVCSLSYDQLSDDERSELGAEIAAVLSYLDANRATFVAQTNEDDFEWARQMIVVAGQMRDDLERRMDAGVLYAQTNSGVTSSAYLEKVFAALGQPLPPMPHVKIADRDYSPEELATYLGARESREEHLADNVAWLVGRYGKVFDFAATAHLDRARSLEDSGSSLGEGYFLAKRFGSRYVVIAGTASEFVDPDPDLSRLRAEQAEREPSFEARLAFGGAPGFVLDLRESNRSPQPTAVKTWLSTPQLTWIGPVKYLVVPRASYDAVYWFSTATPRHELAR